MSLKGVINVFTPPTSRARALTHTPPPSVPHGGIITAASNFTINRVSALSGGIEWSVGIEYLVQGGVLNEGAGLPLGDAVAITKSAVVVTSASSITTPGGNVFQLARAVNVTALSTVYTLTKITR